MIFLNYKTYESGTGDRALSMSKMVDDLSHTSGVKIVPVVQSSDISEITKNVTVEVWAQKVDPVTFGAHTGAVLPESVFEDGAIGRRLGVASRFHRIGQS